MTPPMKVFCWSVGAAAWGFTGALQLAMEHQGAFLFAAISALVWAFIAAVCAA